jgi:hypothetical protein
MLHCEWAYVSNRPCSQSAIRTDQNNIKLLGHIIGLFHDILDCGGDLIFGETELLNTGIKLIHHALADVNPDDLSYMRKQLPSNET